MSIEVNCPSCGGSIQIEAVSEIVACPLCQMHLQVDAETSEPVLVSEEDAAEDAATEEAVATAGDPDPAVETDDLNESDPTPPEVGFAVPDESDSSDNEGEAAAASPFSFLPGAAENKNSKKQPERPATNFSFLPGGDGTSPPESQATEPEAPETEAAAGESVEEATTETVAAEETVAATDTEDHDAEATTDASQTEEPVAEETKGELTETEFPPADPPAENAAEEVTAETTTTGPAPETMLAATAPPEPGAQPAPKSYRQGKVVSKRLFTLTLTYALAVTAMLAMLMYVRYQGDPHQLESLPDLKPPVKNDEIALQLIPENATLPAGHVLQLGGPGRRFGNVLVTPLRVTRGPLEFEHYTGDTSQTREPTGDVLKLYLRFENVSHDQTFEPLDQKLLLTRVAGKNAEAKMRANNFVSSVDQKQTDGNRVLIYDMPPSWEWNLKGQNINQENKPQELKPGESFETYVASNEQGIDDLKGELVWRLQIRKGYNPKSHRGVTTLIEVVFHSSQIQSDMVSSHKETQPTT